MGILSPSPPHASRAAALPGPARQPLALDALAGVPLSHSARDQQVSRPFVYPPLHRVHQGLALAWDPPASPKDRLFWLPVPTPWLRQVVLGLGLSGHRSVRGVGALLADLVDPPLSPATVRHRLDQTVRQADAIPKSLDRSALRSAAHAESFQAGQPVLAGADVFSPFGYLLSQEEHRAGATGGVRLLELRERGFRPEAPSAAFAKGWRQGQQEARPGAACRGAVFPALRDGTALGRYLDNRADDARNGRIGLGRRLARFAWPAGKKARGLARRLAAAARAEASTVARADEVGTLGEWLRADVRAVAGPDHATRQALDAGVVAALRVRADRGARPSGAVGRRLANQRDERLAFAVPWDEDRGRRAEPLPVSPPSVRPAWAVVPTDEARPSRWQRANEFWRRWGSQYALVRSEGEERAAEVVRAASGSEHRNSRRSNDCLLGQQLGPG